MVKGCDLLDGIREQPILLLGDLILDRYTIGQAERISPEAPVAIIEAKEERNRAGGAGNVAGNLVAMGAQVRLMARIGADSAGKQLNGILHEMGVDLTGLFVQEKWPTPVKNRIIANGQQITRVDREEPSLLPTTFEEKIIQSLPALLKGVKAVAISDYSKGFLTPPLLNALYRLANAWKIPIVTDPKGVDFTKYRGTTVIKPNRKEAYLAATLPKEAPLERVAERLFESTGADVILITLAEDGIALFSKEGQPTYLPTHVCEVTDVTGAGDTGLAMLTVAIANQLSLLNAASLSNLACSLAVEKFGCACISIEALKSRLKSLTFPEN